MNILNKHARLIATLYMALDILILFGVTWALKDMYPHPRMVRLLILYGVSLQLAFYLGLHVYRSWRTDSFLPQIRVLAQSWILVLIVFNILIFFQATPEQFQALWPLGLFRSPEFCLWAVGVFAGQGLLRVVVRAILVTMRRRGLNQRWALVVGAGDLGINFARYVDENPWMGIRIFGFFDDRLNTDARVTGGGKILGRVLGPISEAPGFCAENDVDMLFVALPLRAHEKINRLVWDLGTQGVIVYLLPDVFAFGLQKADLRSFGDIHVMAFNLFPSWKRWFDVAFSLFAILVTMPLWLPIVIAIRLEDRGPIFYGHPRVTESGKRFKCLKFRTMHVNADKRLAEMLDSDPALREEWDRTYKLKNDPRITRVGRILRRTSLDELPQFLNVLAGRMSVVGARPVVPEELAKYYKETALTYCAMKPGITGPWQVGKRSDTEDYDERVQLDRWYVLNSSIGLDLWIVAKTVWVMLTGKGAY